MKRKVKSGSFALVRFIFLFGLAFVIIYPLFLKLMISLRSPADILDSSIAIYPKHFSLISLKNAANMMNYSKAFTNTLFISVMSGVLHVISCGMTAYCLAKFNFVGKKIVYLAVILTFFIPQQLISLPTYSVFKDYGLMDNPIALFCLYGTANALKSGLYIYLLIQFFRGLPKELDEAAAVDGAGKFRTMITIAVPIARIMLVTVFLFTFVWQWTDLTYSSMFFQDFDILSLKLMMVGQTLALQTNAQATPLEISQIVSSGSIVFMVPLLAVYLLCNKAFVQGIERSGVVG